MTPPGLYRPANAPPPTAGRSWFRAAPCSLAARMAVRTSCCGYTVPPFGGNLDTPTPRLDARFRGAGVLACGGRYREAPEGRAPDKTDYVNLALVLPRPYPGGHSP